MNAALALQIGTVARRSIVRTMRQPAMVVPALVFPLLLLSINSGGLHAATRLPGFPTDSYLTFALGLLPVEVRLSGLDRDPGWEIRILPNPGLICARTDNF